jgi:beta-galactosidase
MLYFWGNVKLETMRSRISFVLLLFILLSFGSVFAQSGRERTSFNHGWKFSLSADSTSIGNGYDDQSWRQLDVPHDWSIEGPFSETNPSGVGGGALPGGLGWYRKKFRVSQSDKARRFYIRFDGVYCNSEVWINGKHLGRRPNGYISFEYDLTPHIKVNEENVIVVKVDNSQQPNSRWYSGSGIYRNVWLIKTDNIHVDPWGTVITTPTVNNDRAVVEAKTTVKNSLSNAASIILKSTLIDSKGKAVATVTSDLTVKSNEAETVSQRFEVVTPSLWSVESPYLYTLRSTLIHQSKVIDEYDTKVGIRTFEFDAHKGFSLNGKPMKILGVCNHHDLGALGAAVNIRALERQLEIMKAMGVNGIRTSHNPPAPELLDLCDKMGFIVMDEMFDMWKKKKSTYDYSLHWDAWHKRDLEDFIRRDRNHPSVMIWSIGNEIGEQWDSTGTAITKELVSIVKALDTTRPITTGNNETKPNNSIIKSNALDIIGYNYNHNEYADFHQRYPGKKFIATETTSALATRGHYDMPSDSVRRWPIAWDKVFTEGNKDNTVSAYDNVSAPWGSTHEETWKVMKKYPHLSGMFIWTGFDYLGEPTPYVWPSRSSYFGVVDLAGFPKDAYYMYQSEWTTTPVLHIFPHWNWQAGQVVDVWAYYNQADEVELFLNGVSQGIRRKHGDNLHVIWRIPFSPGTLKAVSRKEGKEILVKEIRTAGEPHHIVMRPDRTQLKANGEDMTFVTVEVVDREGNVVPHADNTISFSIEGKAVIAAVDNGDPTSHELFQSTSRKVFKGKALIFVKSNEPGGMRIKASANGLKEGMAKVIFFK